MGAWNVIWLAQCLSSMHEALTSVHSTQYNQISHLEGEGRESEIEGHPRLSEKAALSRRCFSSGENLVVEKTEK